MASPLKRKDGVDPVTKRRGSKTKGAYTDAQLDALVEEATVDAHDEDEQVSGFYSVIEDELELPFQTEVLGVSVTVESIDVTGGNDLVAICKSGNKKQRIRLVDLPLPDPPPKGAQWIAAYRHWLPED